MDAEPQCAETKVTVECEAPVRDLRRHGDPELHKSKPTGASGSADQKACMVGKKSPKWKRTRSAKRGITVGSSGSIRPARPLPKIDTSVQRDLRDVFADQERLHRDVTVPDGADPRLHPDVLVLDEEDPLV